MLLPERETVGKTTREINELVQGKLFEDKLQPEAFVLPLYHKKDIA